MDTARNEPWGSFLWPGPLGPAPEVTSAARSDAGGGWETGGSRELEGVKRQMLITRSARAWNVTSAEDVIMDLVIRLKRRQKYLRYLPVIVPGLCKMWFPGLVENRSGQLALF